LSSNPELAPNEIRRWARTRCAAIQPPKSRMPYGAFSNPNSGLRRLASGLRRPASVV